MWERFSYYGMRALLVLFFNLYLSKGVGLGALRMRYHCMARIQWPFITPVIGGLLADRYLGYRWAVILGALAMTLDMHLAVETPLFYISELDFNGR
jgi:POT family proton-dependent oligopeptide transporter